MSSMKKDLSPREKYWRSLDDLADTAEFKELVQREFPENASELTNSVSRRNFLSLMGASIALAGLASCRRPVEKIVPYVIKPQDVIPGISQHYATAIPMGTSAYGVMVRSNEGRPTKIEGNPLHPSTRGAATHWMQAEILNLYDPDRSKTVSNDNADKTWQDFVAAWKELYSQLSGTQGAGLAVLMESFSSPTLARLQAEFRKAFPKAVWVTRDAVSDENIFTGLKMATGSDVRPLNDYSNAQVILSLESDFLGTESESLMAARGFAEGRRIRTADDSMNRLYVVESTYSLTGTMADHRLRIQSSQVGAFVAALATELANQGLAVEGLSAVRAEKTDGLDSRWIKAVAKDLIRAKGSSIVTAGRRQPAPVHALVSAINFALGNVGQTVVYVPLQDASISNHAAFANLVKSMNDGAIQTLVMLGGNPVYDAPADLAFGAALEKVKTRIHFALYADETSTRSTWHVPQAHFLESWGDVRSADGTISVIQPLIEPLYGAKTTVEFLTLLVRNTESSGYDTVRETWKSYLGGVSFDSQWRRVLHDGLFEGSSLEAAKVKVDAKSLAAGLASVTFSGAPGSASAFELNFIPSASIWDGRYANNGWLQELPNSITKITWDNVALISVKAAKELSIRQGLSEGEYHQPVIRLSYEGRSLDVPVWIQPGQADYSISIALGYGRQAAGLVGNGVGVNAFALQTSVAPAFGGGLQLAKLDSTYPIACTQDHGGYDEEELARAEVQHRLPRILREATLEEYRAKPTFASNDEMIEGFKSLKDADGKPISIYDTHDYSEGYQWGMSIDLNACIGCNACTIACQSENNIPVIGKNEVMRGREMHWIRMDRYFKGSVDEPTVAFQPVACHHCETAPCEQVCPVAATVHDGEGLNVMVYNRCVGTRYCANNCPYKVRRFNFLEYNTETSGFYQTEGAEVLKMAKNPDVTVRMRGVMEKCSYCVQRISSARIAAKKANRTIRDGEVVTACQQTCPTQAIVFGNINDPSSAVVRAKSMNRNYELLAELNVRPRTSYLAKLRNPNNELASESAG